MKPILLLLAAPLLLAGGCSLRTSPTSSLEESRPERAVALNPDNAHAHFQLGRIALDEGRTGEAAGHFRRARTIQPTFEEAWNGEGIAFLDAREYGRAATHFAAMAEALPSSVPAVEGRAAAALGLRRLDEAKTFATDALNRDAKSAQGYRILGEVAYINGDYALAAENWKRALELNPSLGSVIRPTLEDLNGYIGKYGAKPKS